jgi:hypothetical protein
MGELGKSAGEKQKPKIQRSGKCTLRGTKYLGIIHSGSIAKEFLFCREGKG